MNVIEEVDAGYCRLRVEGHIIVKMFGIGRLAERIIIESTLKTLRALPAITERWSSEDSCLWKPLVGSTLPCMHHVGSQAAVWVHACLPADVLRAASAKAARGSSRGTKPSSRVRVTGMLQV